MVNQLNDDGDLIATAVKRTVHTGNKVVAILAVFVYALKILVPKDSGSGDIVDCRGIERDYLNYTKLKV